MDQEKEIKEEPVWLEGTTYTSFENFELVSEMIPLKQEIKSELTEPVPAQENAFQPSADIKEKILVEKHTVDLLVPYIKEETKVDNVAVLTMPSGEKPYRCEECRSTFTARSSLKSHTLIHTGTRSYRCKECGSTFNRRATLRTHMFTHSRDSPYHCTECNTMFTTKGSLRYHMIIHTGARPYRCGECGSTFNRQYNLRTHMVIHTGVRRYCCKECGGMFTARSSLDPIC